MRHARKPARVKEEDSETPYMTRRGMDFIREAGDKPWCLHLSYIKPHWPYIAPAPYNDMYSEADVIPAVRSEEEREQPASGRYARFMDYLISKSFSRDEVREEVIPVYMGLIKQIDDQMGVLFRFSRTNGYFDNTMIVFTSDHGDYLGDHWLGEKELFHEPSVKVPLIIYDPSAAADATRGTTCDELVEAIDLAPTFLEVFGGDPAQQSHRLEGRSLVPLLHGQKPADWRRYVISEYDYSLQYGAAFDTAPARSAAVHGRRQGLEICPRHRLPADAVRSQDRSAGTARSRRRPAYDDVRRRYAATLAEWGLRLSQRATRSEQQIRGMRGKAGRRGILIGVWDESDVPDELWKGYLGDAR